VFKRLRALLPGWPAGRWFVLGGLAIGLFFGIQKAATGSSLYGAFLMGLGAAAAVMVLLALAQRLYEGSRVQSAQLPGGAGAEFETAEAASKTREGVEKLNERVTMLSEQLITMQAQLDRRVSDLEATAFKEPDPRREKKLGE
jgi:TolA-binding protein